MNLKHFFKKQTGFSLMELLITVAIIGILGSIGIPTYRRQQTKARRGECKAMLSALSISQTTYISNESITYNQIHCPKILTTGLHTRTISNPDDKNVIVIPLTERDNYCGLPATNGPSNSEGSTYHTPSPIKTAYQYRYMACPGNSLTCDPSTDIALGTLFPPFAVGNNYMGFPNPTTAAPSPIHADLTPAAGPAQTYQYIVQCHGNIDSDTTSYDAVSLDHTGTIVITHDDVKN